MAALDVKGEPLFRLTARFRALLLGAVDGPPALLVLGTEPCVALALGPLELTLELAVALQPLRIEPPLRDCQVHRAIGLGAVLTVREAALRRERRHVLEDVVHLLGALEQLQLAQPGSVEDETAALEDDQLAVRGRVPPAPVLTNLLCDEQLT